MFKTFEEVNSIDVYTIEDLDDVNLCLEDVARSCRKVVKILEKEEEL